MTGWWTGETAAWFAASGFVVFAAGLARQWRWDALSLGVFAVICALAATYVARGLEESLVWAAPKTFYAHTRTIAGVGAWAGATVTVLLPLWRRVRRVRAP